MAETLWTWHELIIKAYDEVWWELLYSWGFIIEPNDTVENFLLDNGITLSNVATAEVACAMTQDTFTLSSWTTQTFTQILSWLTFSYTCAQDDADAGKCTLWEQFSWDWTEVPATLVMSVYGVLNKENNQHGAIFTWHSVSYNDYSAMQWPAPTWYHVPSKDERVALCGILTSTFGLASNATTMGTYLKMPMAGYRNGSSSNVGSVGSNGLYWSSTAYSAVYAYSLYFNSSSLSPQTGDDRAYGLTVRCFKDTPIIPDSSWTTLYDWSSIATGAWVFYNATDGLISVSWDWQTWYTIQDKNLWATTVYNQWDTETDANCGYFYQRGNNYGFAHSGTITTSTTQVDASSYWPGNYYSSSTFITRSESPYDWSSVENDNLRWWVTWVQSWYKLLHKEFYLDYSAMRGPCPEGYHIPLNTERQAVYNIWTALWWWASAWNDFLNALKMPKIWHLINQNGTVVDRDNYWDYWSSAPSYTTTVNNVSFYMHAYNNNSINPQDSLVRPNGMCLRAFKDEPVVPNSTRTMLYWISLTSWWIFWNQTAWLISMSSDWATWITIRDKNEWATSVYNNWDTKTAANCWWYYQRWNNHLFPFGSEVTTGAELVDTTWYWPGNYYSGTTFIVTNTSPNDWSSIRNDNLRWWVTWAVERGRRVI